MSSISVIVPVYNVEAYLHRCIDSILSQTYTDFELILVDDGSPDNCPDICDQYAKKDSRVHVIHQNNGGLSAARNAGIDWAFEHSNSEWITFIDSDDWVHFQYLEILMSALQAHNTNISICNYKKTYTVTKDIEIQNPPYILDAEEAYTHKYQACMTACCKIYRKEVFKEIRFPFGKLHEDAFITHKLLFKEKQISLIDEELYYYFYNENSITKSPWKPGRLDEVEAHEIRLQFLCERDFKQALNRELKAYLMCLTYQIKEITNGDCNYNTYEKVLRKKLKKAIKASKNIFDITIHSFLEIYETAYPKHMWFYWRWMAVTNRLKLNK